MNCHSCHCFVTFWVASSSHKCGLSSLFHSPSALFDRHVLKKSQNPSFFDWLLSQDERIPIHVESHSFPPSLSLSLSHAFSLLHLCGSSSWPLMEHKHTPIFKKVSFSLPPPPSL